MERKSLQRMDRSFDDGVRAELRSQRRDLGRGKAGKVGAFESRILFQGDDEVSSQLTAASRAKTPSPASNTKLIRGSSSGPNCGGPASDVASSARANVRPCYGTHHAYTAGRKKRQETGSAVHLVRQSFQIAPPRPRSQPSRGRPTVWRALTLSPHSPHQCAPPGLQVPQGI